MTEDRHPEDCLICRARALELTDAQVEFINEVLAAAIGAGWRQRGNIRRTPTDAEAQQMMILAHINWAELFGTPIPESAEVRAHREGH